MAKLKQKLSELRRGISVKKDGHNPFFKSKYYELEDILNALKDSDKFGIGFVQYIEWPFLVTEIQHDEETISSRVRLPEIELKNHQEVAKIITYFRRISLITMFGICEPDDDGNTNAGAIYRSQQSPGGAAPIPSGDTLAADISKCQTVKDLNNLYYRLFKSRNIVPSDEVMDQFKQAKEEIKDAI